MIVYGTKARALLTETLMEKCPNCGTQHSVEMHVIQKYVHVFWIPFFPAGKTGVSQCTQCKQILKLKQMPDSFKLDYDNLKRQTRTPIYMFSGIALVGVLIAFGIVSEQRKTERNAKLILSPQRNDIYEVKKSSDTYTLYKVSDVNGDSVSILYNRFESNKASGLSQIKKKGMSAYIVDEPDMLSKSDLKHMFDKGEIVDIDR